MRRATSRVIEPPCQSCSAKVRTSINAPKHFVRPSSLHLSQRRAARSTATIPLGARWAATIAKSTSAAVAGDRGTRLDSTAESQARAPLRSDESGQSTHSALANSVNASWNEFINAVNKAPNEALTVAALRACFQAATKLHPHIKTAKAKSKTSASRLAVLGAERAGTTLPIDADILVASNKISKTAYDIVTHPNVEFTSDALEAYVTIQSLLGRSESLPSVLELYAYKPKPEMKNGVVHYVSQNPNSVAKAIEKPVADMALQTAIDAKNLDAALGITDAAFCVKAFKRQKLLKKGSPPAMALATLPFGIVGLASAYATYWQNTMDFTTATGLGIAGISGYFFVTGSLGLIAKLSHKDHMKRVTWLPGTPLRYRWLREEEREALDKIACAWGFRESWRYGEETGPDWEGLREHMGYRQMILDRVEFMEGMN